jgi:hypothetical protein
MCVGAKFVASEWVPLSSAIFRFWRIQRVIYVIAWVPLNGRYLDGWSAYVRTHPVWFQ